MTVSKWRSNCRFLGSAQAGQLHYLEWARTVGAQSVRVVECLLGDVLHPAAALNACATLQKLARQYTAERFELACGRAMAIQSPTVKSIRSILQNGLERHVTDAPAQRGLPLHLNVRGPQYYQAEEVSNAD